MSVIIGYRNLAQEAILTAPGSVTNPENMINNFTEVSSQIQLDDATAQTIRLQWSSPVKASSFALQQWSGGLSGDTWRINRYSSFVPAGGSLIDQSPEMLVRKSYPGESLLSLDEPVNSRYTFTESNDGYVSVSDSVVQSVNIVLRTPSPGSPLVFLGMLAAMETVSLEGAHADGQTGGGGLDQNAKVIFSFNGGVAPADEQEIETANFHVSRMTTADKNTMKSVQKAAGLTAPAWFEPYGFRLDSADSVMEGGVVRFVSKFQVTPMRPQAGTEEDQFEARGVTVSPWI